MANREKVIKEFEEICGYTLRSHEFRVLNDVLALLKEQEEQIENLRQTAQSMMEGVCLLKERSNCENCAIAIEDRQPIVRCKDCKHYRINTVYPGTNMIITYCAKTGITESNPDWFCADGESKEVR